MIFYLIIIISILTITAHVLGTQSLILTVGIVTMTMLTIIDDKLTKLSAAQKEKEEKDAYTK